MRVKQIYISQYKNLKDFNIEFEGDSFIDVFIGKNGTGKSNFLEACLEIFKHIYEKESSISFNYKFVYEINEKEFTIEWKDVKWVNKEGEKCDLPDDENLPDNILIYYSGHNKTITKLVEHYESNYKAGLNRNRKKKSLSKEETRKFIGIGSDYKSLLITVLLLQSDDLNAKKFIVDKLGIESLGEEIKFIFKRPEYASDKKKFHFDEIDPEKRFWGAEGFIRTFLDDLYDVKRKSNPPARREGYINDEKVEEYILFRDIQSFQETFKTFSSLELFIALDDLKSIGMLMDISIDIKLNTGKKMTINQFSDGQFQSIYIYAITEIFKDKNCVSLLDEPDSFLHPEWQYDFLNQIFEISAESNESNHVLMTSHSAVTLIPHKKDKIRFFDFKEDSSINSYELPKRIAINRLSSNLIQYSEQDQILSIINTIQIENKPVLFTEGKTDPLIIKEAWGKIMDEEMPFIPFYAFGHAYLSRLIKDESLINEMGGLPVFGLFDYDEAFNSWNSFSDIEVCEDVNNGLIKKAKDYEVYAIMLPVPKDKPVECQVKNKETGGTYGDRSLLGIEHLFCHIDGCKKFFEKDISRPDKFIKFKGDKVSFAKMEVPKIPKAEFEVFRPIFDFIKSKIGVKEV